MNKDLLNQLSENKVKVDVANIREVASIYKDLKEVADLVKAKMTKLEGLLRENHVNEYFIDDSMKVVEQAGSELSTLDNSIILSELNTDEIIALASFSATSLKEAGKEDLAVRAKKMTGTFKKSSIKVAKMTKVELKEIEEKELLKSKTI